MAASTQSSVKRNYFFGWNLLYNSVEKVINKKEDVLVILLHFQLTKHFDFQCIGVGDDETIVEDDQGDELLPDGWNDDKNLYELRYMCNGKLYLLHAVKTKHSFIITLLDPKEKGKKQNILMDTDLVNKVEPKCRNLDLVPTASDILDRYYKELIEPVILSSNSIFHTGQEKPMEEDLGQHFYI